MRLVDHPNVVRYYGVESLDGDMFVFLEYAGGGSLHERIYDGKVGDDFQTQFWMRQTGEALRFLHRHDIVHRDLKPGNLLLKNNMIKIGDFGGAKIHQRCCDSPHLTQVFGSPSYMAPEVITKSPMQGHKGGQDVWSLGCCLYEMILAKPPWHHLDNVFALYFHVGTWAAKNEGMVLRESEGEGVRFPRCWECRRHAGCMMMRNGG
ncbi:kinase-like domain-containing protein [Chytridium lagenaria]|nr:kinase-like domain-containing protein [Chytridium lagenaria]